MTEKSRASLDDKRSDDSTGVLLRRSTGDARGSRPNQAKAGEALAERIEHEIIALGWPVGHVFGSEPELVERYGVSRAVFREAVRILEHQMVAEMRRGPRGGLVITAPDPIAVTNAVALYLEYRGVQPHNLLQLRFLLEYRSIELATQRLDDAGIERLRQIVADEAGMDAEDFAAHSHVLHIALAEMAGDPVLELFLKVLTHLTREHATPAAQRPERSSAEARAIHADIVDAVVAGDAALARHRMMRHLEAIEPWLH